MEKIRPDELLDAGGNFSYLVRCVALVSLLMEYGILDELIETGRITQEEVDQRVAVIEKHFPAFKTMGVDASKGDENK